MRRASLAALLATASVQCWAMDRDMLESAMGAAHLSLQHTDAAPGSLAVQVEVPTKADLDPVAHVEGESAALDDDAETAALRMSPAAERKLASTPGGVAIIPVRGIISNRLTFMDLMMGTRPNSPGAIAQAVAMAVNDPQVKAVILDFDSPGGVVTGVPEAFARIFAMRGKKPLLAQVSGSCGSAAYWLAAACDEISATPTALVGSIGCYQVHEELSKMYADIGVVVTYIADTPDKVEGNDTQPLAPEALAHRQGMVNGYSAMFLRDIKQGRGQSMDVPGRGRAYLAGDALSRGLIDKVRDLQDSLVALGMDSPSTPPTNTRGPRSNVKMLGLQMRATATV
jgi:signal peptide peptidase SppA